MKKILILMAFTIFATSQAQVKYEFDESTEHRCHLEIKKLGCSIKGESEDKLCVEKKKLKLTAECRKLHEDRKAKS